MKDQQVIKIVDVDRLDNGLVVRFDDGRSAFYPALLLLEMFPRAEEMQKKAAIEGLEGFAESS